MRKSYLTRGYQGKAMVVAIDRYTAVNLFNRVQSHWQAHLASLKAQLQQPQNEFEQKRLEKQISYMEATDMAVVVSPS